jgi:NADH-quinone oxidoreductase subunit D
MPYLAYDKVDFDVIVGTYGDNFDRYSIRLNEIRESIKIIRQVLERMPPGTTACRTRRSPRRRGPASTNRWRRSSTTSRSSPRASRCPRARSTSPSSPPGRARLLHGLRRTAKPYRMHIRGPSFVNLQALPVMLRGGLMADAVAVISSVDPVMGEVDR